MHSPGLTLQFVLIAVCAFYLPAAHSQTFTGKVVAIADGDTLTVVTASKRKHRIRLAGIDAPEKHQSFGTRSKESLADLCFGKQAEVTSHVTDRYKRRVANVRCAGVDASAEQVSRGMAWVYRRYVSGNYHFYLLEFGARIAQRGLWTDPDPVAPWEWRNHKKQHVQAF